MEALFIYLGKMIFISVIFWMYYKLFLEGKEFHHYNRFYLLSSAILSIFLPLIKVNWFSIQPNHQGIYEFISFVNGSEISVSTAQNSISEWVIFGILTASVSFILMIRFLLAVIKIQHFKRKFTSEKHTDFTLIMTDLEFAPFTFLKNLFWNQQIDFTSVQGEKIFKHELAHITQRHTLDRILLQVIKSIFWFNPIFYLIQREVILLHEYLADEKAIENKDAAAFAEMLLTQQFYHQKIDGISPFFSSTIKKRLEMITKKHHTRFSYARRIWALPLLFLLTFAYLVQAKNQEIKAENEKIEQINQQFQIAHENQLENDTIKEKLIRQKRVLERQLAEIERESEKIEKRKLKIEETKSEIENLASEIESKKREIESIAANKSKISKEQTIEKLKEIEELHKEVENKVNSIKEFKFFPDHLQGFSNKRLDSISHRFNSPEWKKIQKDLSNRLKYFNSPEYQEYLGEIVQKLHSNDYNLDFENMKEFDFPPLPQMPEMPRMPEFFGENSSKIPTPPTPPTPPAVSQTGKGKIKLHFDNDAEFSLEYDGKGKITTRVNPKDLNIYINGKKSTRAQLEQIDMNRIKNISLDTQTHNSNSKAKIKITTK
ncbi:MAG: M56 family metallopeptidase [Flavobacteriaceae bacterium]|nr:M56 family metallopeptidase [Flavobacteriaceae bacterium]